MSSTTERDDTLKDTMFSLKQDLYTIEAYTRGLSRFKGVPPGYKVISEGYLKKKILQMDDTYISTIAGPIHQLAEFAYYKLHSEGVADCRSTHTASFGASQVGTRSERARMALFVRTALKLSHTVFNEVYDTRSVAIVEVLFALEDKEKHETLPEKLEKLREVLRADVIATTDREHEAVGIATELDVESTAYKLFDLSFDCLDELVGLHVIAPAHMLKAVKNFDLLKSVDNDAAIPAFDRRTTSVIAALESSNHSDPYAYLKAQRDAKLAAIVSNIHTKPDEDLLVGWWEQVWFLPTVTSKVRELEVATPRYTDNVFYSNKVKEIDDWASNILSFADNGTWRPEFAAPMEEVLSRYSIIRNE